MRKYNAESPKQGSIRFNSIVKTKYIDVLGIVYLCRGLFEQMFNNSIGTGKDLPCKFFY